MTSIKITSEGLDLSDKPAVREVVNSIIGKFNNYLSEELGIQPMSVYERNIISEFLHVAVRGLLDVTDVPQGGENSAIKNTSENTEVREG